MPGPRSYIVRVYRQGFRSLAGVVEDIATQGQRAFRDVNELSKWLRGPIHPERPQNGEAPTTQADKEDS